MVAIRVVLTAALVFPPLARAQEDAPYDFALKETFIQDLAASKSIIYSMRLKMGGHSKVHDIKSDCEMHIAGVPVDPLASPGGLVVEPPNLCRNRAPPGNRSWPGYFDRYVTGQWCVVSGFPRIFSEHAKGGGDPSNPDHVLELHPMLTLKCDGTNLDTSSFLKVYEGMRHVKDATADNCLKHRKLWMRRNEGMLEFREEGGGSCGNFGVVSLSLYKKEWVHSIGGGHAAIVRGRVGPGEPFVVKAYTLSGTKADDILAGALAGQELNKVSVLGVITYDFFNINRTLGNLANTGWTEVRYPLALVLFGVAGVEAGPEDDL